MRALVLALGLITASAVAQVSQTQDQRVTTLPQVGSTAIVSAGEPIWTVESTPVTSRMSRKIVISKKIKLGNFMKGSVTIPQDADFTQRDNTSGVVACTRLSMTLYRSKPCLIDQDNDGSFEAVSFKTDGAPEPLAEPVRYERVIADQSTRVGNSFRSVISYLGSNGASLSLSYREFVNDMARPAFTEELAIPLEKVFPQEIRAKGVTIRVHRINGLGMEYTVLDALPPTQS